MNSILLTDGYKLSHHQQYPEGTTLVFSNFTPRSDSHAPEGAKGGVVVFGIQMMLQMIHEHFAENFFKTEERIIYADSDRRIAMLKKQVLTELKTELDYYLGGDYDVTHFEKLWDLGYLPIEVRALGEGTICPIRVPMLTIHNTDEDFYWLPNFLETIISNLLWKPVTSATIARAYKTTLTKWAAKTDVNNLEFVDWQGHDFSMRGLDSVDATISSGMGHLTSFKGTDSLPAVYGTRKYYDAEGFVAGSVPATEHSVMSANIENIEAILGVIELLWDIFGGTINEQGYKVLDSHIGAIYGDSITLARAEEICKRLEAKGFASTNVVLGVGSFTYQYNTRDTYGMAMKATYVEIEENFYASPESLEPGIRTIGREIFKDPVTDNGMKKSAKGLLKVIEEKGTLSLKDGITWDELEAEDNLLKVRYKDGEFFNTTTFEEIREILK